MPKGSPLLKPGNAYMEILPPVASSGYTRETKDLLMQDVRDILCTAFDRIREKSL